MDFNLSEEQVALQDSLLRYLSRQHGFEQRRATADSPLGFSEAAWSVFADMGLLALPLPEADGGLGGTAVDTFVVMQALGQHLALEPYVTAVVVGGSLLADLGSPGQRDTWLPQIAAGTLRVALAHEEAGRRYDRRHVAARATPHGDGFVLHGHKCCVIGAPSAQRLWVSARVEGGDASPGNVGLFAVDPDQPGVAVAPYALHDGQRAADVRLEHVEVAAGARLGDAGDALPAIERALDRGIAALCAEAVGLMGAINAATLDHLKTRRQFGVPIGKFQVLQHRMADMAIATEQALSMATLAALKADSADAADRSRMVSAAKAYIGEAARIVGQGAVQLHGGMGVTDELAVAHAFKRLTMIDLTWGDADHHLARFSDTLRAA